MWTSIGIFANVSSVWLTLVIFVSKYYCCVWSTTIFAWVNNLYFRNYLYLSICKIMHIKYIKNRTNDGWESSDCKREYGLLIGLSSVWWKVTSTTSHLISTSYRLLYAGSVGRRCSKVISFCVQCLDFLQ